MFRVVGLDAKGIRRVVSVSAATEDEARATALSLGVSSVEEVSIPPPLRRSTYSLNRSGFGVSSLILFLVVLLGFPAAGWARMAEPSGGGKSEPFAELFAGLTILAFSDGVLVGLRVACVVVRVVGLGLGILGAAVDERNAIARVAALLHCLLIASAGCFLMTR